LAVLPEPKAPAAQAASDDAFACADDAGAPGTSPGLRRWRARWCLIRGTVVTAARDWYAHRADLQAAAISFYMIFSIAPLLVITVAILGRVVGEQEVRAQVLEYFRVYIGENAARYMNSVIDNARRPQSSLLATLISSALLIVSITGAFGQLTAALDQIWEVKTNPKSAWRTIVRARLVSALMVAILAAIILATLVASTWIAAAQARAAEYLPEQIDTARVAELSVSFLTAVIVFAVVFRVLPGARIGWREVWFGAAVSALLFGIGKYFIGLYLGRSSTASVYGAAGSLAVVLIWIYYSTLIFLFGAELTHVTFQRMGKKPLPKEHAKTEPGSEQRAEARAEEAAKAVAVVESPEPSEVVGPPAPPPSIDLAEDTSAPKVPTPTAPRGDIGPAAPFP
jgi:membrane protein